MWITGGAGFNGTAGAEFGDPVPPAVIQVSGASMNGGSSYWGGGLSPEAPSDYRAAFGAGGPGGGSSTSGASIGVARNGQDGVIFIEWF